MDITPEIAEVIQTSLNKHYKKNLVVDGDPGRRTMGAIAVLNIIPAAWDKERTLIGYVQHACSLESMNAGPVDGYWGPQTQYGYDQLKELLLDGKKPGPWRDDEGIGLVPGNTEWPIQTQTELTRFYGPVGSNQVMVNTPYPLRIAWDLDKTLTRFSCHEKVARSVERIMIRVKDHYGDQVSDLGLDLFGGCLNVRPMRGGTKYSTHAWGIAIDWDPARNQLRWGRDKANFARPEYNVWWSLWEEEGAVSLGRTKNYDWMHIQFCKVKV